MESLSEYLGSLLEPWQGIWGWYSGLDPEQQRSALLLTLVALVGAVAWGMYQTHGDRVVVVLPAMMLRYSLLLLAHPFVLAGKIAGRGWGMPEFLTRDWTAEPDPDRPEIKMETVNPMKLPRDARARLSARPKLERAKQKRR